MKRLIISRIEENSVKGAIKADLEKAAMLAQSAMEQNNLRAEVYFVEDSQINACVGKKKGVEGQYDIYIYDGVIDTLKMSLQEKYMNDICDEDLQLYQFDQSDTYFRIFDDDSLKNSFMNSMAMFIIHNIFFHECGHILLGHCENCKFQMSELKTRGGARSGYGHQAREMLADWYGIKQSLLIFVYGFRKEYTYKMDNLSDVFLMRRILVMSFMALYCQFDLFEESATNGNKNGYELSEYALKQRSHPHPYTRLLYCLDAVRESMMDIINIENNVDNTISENFVNMLLNSAMEDIKYFLKKMNGPDIEKILRIPTIIEAYYQLRKNAWKKHRNNRAFINVRMEKMPEAYLKNIRKYKKQFD